MLSGNNTNVNTTAERAALPIDYPPSLTYTAPVGHILRPVRPLPPLPPVPPVCHPTGLQRRPQVVGGRVEGQDGDGGSAEKFKRADGRATDDKGDKAGQSDNGSKTGRQSGKATKEERGANGWLYGEPGALFGTKQ